MTAVVASARYCAGDLAGERGACPASLRRIRGERNGAGGLVLPEDHVAYAPPEWVDESEYHGHDGLRRLSEQWTENFDDFRLHLRDIRDAGDSVVVLVEATGRINGSDVPIETQAGVVYADFAKGMIGSTRYFLSWQDALEAAGLRD
jgi:hypothetical protein